MTRIDKEEYHMTIKKLTFLILLFISTELYGIDCGSVDGISLPCYKDFLDSEEGNESLPNYPYAKRPNGCSIPSKSPGYFDTFNSGGTGVGAINISFKDICDEHDICYYTLNTGYRECNARLSERFRARCEREVSNHRLNGYDVFTFGASRAVILAACYTKGESIHAAVVGTQSIYHTEAQESQKKYLQMVKDFVHESKKKIADDNKKTLEQPAIYPKPNLSEFAVSLIFLGVIAPHTH